MRLRQVRGGQGGRVLISVVILLLILGAFLLWLMLGGEDGGQQIAIPTQPPTAPIQIETATQTATATRTQTPIPLSPTATASQSATPAPTLTAPILPPPLPLQNAVEVAVAPETFGVGLPPVTGRFGGLYDNPQLTAAGHIMLLVPESADSGAFAIDAFEVTLAQFAAFLNDLSGGVDVSAQIGPESGLGFRAGLWGFSADSAALPIDQVGAVLARTYCSTLGGDLPTQDQWLRAALWGGEAGWRDFPWGDQPPDRTFANFAGDSPAPRQSYDKGRSWIGAYHLAGNVAEWVILPEGVFGIMGGDYSDSAVTFAETITTPRLDDGPSAGFRCVRVP